MLSHKEIAKNYLKFWFTFDIISILPISLVFSTSDYASLVRLTKLPKLYRLVKLTKLTRLLRMIKERNTISKYLNEVLKLSVGVERLAFFMLIFVLSVHITACFWVIIPSYEEN